MKTFDIVTFILETVIWISEFFCWFSTAPNKTIHIGDIAINSLVSSVIFVRSRWFLKWVRCIQKWIYRFYIEAKSKQSLFWIFYLLLQYSEWAAIVFQTKNRYCTIQQKLQHLQKRNYKLHQHKNYLNFCFSSKTSKNM